MQPKRGRITTCEVPREDHAGERDAGAMPINLIH
jgi:hypothetical protein